MKKLSQLLKSLTTVTADLDVPINGLALDSRLVKKNDLFIAHKGSHLDGRQFIDDAVGNGAAAIVAEAHSDTHPYHLRNTIPVILIPALHKYIGTIAAEFYDHPADKLSVVGITGTNGKTSSAYFTAQALQELGVKCGVIGTLGKGIYGNVKFGSLTTPDAITLQQTFAEFVHEHAKVVAMEVSSHSIEQQRISGVPFEVSIFTNLTQDHLDYHGDMQTYGAVKKRLFESNATKNAVINVDDQFGNEIYRELHTTKNSYPCSLNSTNKNLPNAIVAEHIVSNANGIKAMITTPWGAGELQTKLVGEFNLSNVLGVLAALCVMGYPLQDVLRALSKLNSVPGRMQSFTTAEGVLIVVDYAHTPDALEKVLMTLRKHSHKKLLCLFGCGGDRDKGKRPIMAQIAEKNADIIYVTDDNPRHEKSADIIADILKGFNTQEKVNVLADRAMAIKEIIRAAQPGDCVLIAGRGGEIYQQVGDDKIPFCDDEKVKEML